MGTLSKRIFFSGLAIFTSWFSYGQSMSIVNNTDCDLAFSLGASGNEPCTEAISVSGNVPSRTTIRWPNPAAVDWNQKAEHIYWRNFRMLYDGAEVVGHCKGDASFSTILPIATCKTDIEYSWQAQETTGNIEILINTISFRIPSNISKMMERYPPKGGTTVIINTLLEVSVSDNKVKIKANQGFITGVYMANGMLAEGIILSPLSKPTNYEVCRITSLSPAMQQVALRCFCGMEQVFTVSQTIVPAYSKPFIYMVTER